MGHAARSRDTFIMYILAFPDVCALIWHDLCEVNTVRDAQLYPLWTWSSQALSSSKNSCHFREKGEAVSTAQEVAYTHKNKAFLGTYCQLLLLDRLGRKSSFLSQFLWSWEHIGSATWDLLESLIHELISQVCLLETIHSIPHGFLPNSWCLFPKCTFYLLITYKVYSKRPPHITKLLWNYCTQEILWKSPCLDFIFFLADQECRDWSFHGRPSETVDCKHRPYLPTGSEQSGSLRHWLLSVAHVCVKQSRLDL